MSAKWVGCGAIALMMGACVETQKHGGAVDVAPVSRTSEGSPSEPVFSPAWNQIRRGMTPDEVLMLLDEPAHMKVTRVNTYWYYSDRARKGPHVVFDTCRMVVERWKFPS
ncbi:MAG: outer membrane protein assembly factor BamE [bacterium]|nr:outer membrane protein assembly factor BamE [bacterium]